MAFGKSKEQKAEDKERKIQEEFERLGLDVLKNDIDRQEARVLLSMETAGLLSDLLTNKSDESVTAGNTSVIKGQNWIMIKQLARIEELLKK